MGTTTLLKSVDRFRIPSEPGSLTSEEDAEPLGDGPIAAGDSEDMRLMSVAASAISYFKVHNLSMWRTDHLLFATTRHTSSEVPRKKLRQMSRNC
jgi:hypothetical protein